MITLPDHRPGTPDLRSRRHYLWWLARRQWGTLAGGAGLATIWTLSSAAAPAVVGRTIDAGVVHSDVRALATGCLVLLGLAITVAVSGVFRHRLAVANWMQAALRTQQLIGWHAADQGLAVAAGSTTGEVVAGVARDAPRIADLYDVSARFTGAVAAYLAIAVLLIRIDPLVGGLVLAGVPLMSASLAVVIRPLQSRLAVAREQEGKLTALGADTVAGLRVLRGIGGEQVFAGNYAGRSRDVQRAGIAVAAPQATLDTAQVFLGGSFVVAITWLGARAALADRVTPGELVTLYGYAAFLAMPLWTASETLGKVVRGRVAAARVIEVLRREENLDADVPPIAGLRTPQPGSPLRDPASGLTLRPGELTALVTRTTDEAAEVADRLARLAPADGGGRLDIPSPRIGDVAVRELPVADVRARILLSEAEPRLFSGPLREQLDPEGRHPDSVLLAALEVADAADALAAVPGGLAGRLTERARALSGGQRQRLALARALLAEPEVLLLVEPTSAVDAHTEARIAQRLHAARAGRTTLVTTSSPLLLDHADRVVYLRGGRVVAEGTHRELLRSNPDYRDTVIRGEDE